MTDVERVRDEHVMSAIAIVLTAGHSIRHRNGVHIYSRIDDKHPVRFYVVSAIVYEVFNEIRDAIAYYLDLCDESASA